MINFFKSLDRRYNALEEKIDLIHTQLKLARETPSLPIELKKQSVIDSANYVRDTFKSPKVFSHRQETLKYAVQSAKVDGLHVEFGVHSGGTIRQAASIKPDTQFWGFDSFEGLPEDWAGTAKIAGSFDLKGVLPKVPSNVELVAGWFNVTLPEWKKDHHGPIAYCHVDCDLYSSTVTIFEEIEAQFVHGTILLFDEYFGYPDWRNGEHKAFLEMLARTGFSYDAKAISHMALVVQLKKS